MTRTTNMPCLLAVILVFGMSPLRAAAQSVDDVLNTAWEMFWQQSGYPRAVYKWRTPIRVRFSGAFGERQKVFAMEQLEKVADVAGIKVVEADDPSANLLIEIASSSTTRPYNETCTTSSRAQNGVFERSRVLTNEQSIFRCMLHESMHVMGLPGHPMANSVLTYFARPSGLTDVDKLLLKTIYSDEVEPGMSPFAVLAILARIVENSAADKNDARRATAAFVARTSKDMEAFASGSGEPPAAVLRSSKADSGGMARGRTEMQFFLGMAYLKGQLVGVEDAKARHWLTQAANSSHAGARRVLADLAMPIPPR